MSGRRVRKGQPPRRAAAENEVRVRMYDVGFGDCFLVTFRRGTQVSRVLVDCGSIKVGSHALGDVVARVIADVREGSEPARIDLVVATHRHKDHVEGFAAAEWHSVQVGEVWLPWTENPKDPVALRVRAAQDRLARTLQARLQARGDGEDSPSLGMAMNALSNATSMETLRQGFAGRPRRRYLPESDEQRALRTQVLPGVNVHVLGPARDEATIRKLEPPPEQQYLALQGGLAPAEGDAPFPTERRLRPGAVNAAFGDLAVSNREQERVAASGADALDALAAISDSHLNGTSLVLVFSFGPLRLLFSGDAEWGTWERLLADREWRELVGDACFYKVGHHGSYNATPVEFVEKVLSRKALAMVSVTPHGSYKRIPRKPLMEELARRAAGVVRSDHAPSTPLPKGFHRVGPMAIETVFTF